MQQRLFAEPEQPDPVSDIDPHAPLAARMRPRTLDEFVGQQHLLGPNRAFRKALQAGALTSVIFWGPPGVGKTTLARLMARHLRARFVSVSAVTAGVADLRRIIEDARVEQRSGTRTVVFIDEIHRFNKAQQDVVLPHVERGTITLIGATTENPSFEVNAALLSRCRVYVLHALADDDIRRLLTTALNDAQRGLGSTGVTIMPAALDGLISLSNGDARTALGALELAAAALGLSPQPPASDQVSQQEETASVSLPDSDQPVAPPTQAETAIIPVSPNDEPAASLAQKGMTDHVIDVDLLADVFQQRSLLYDKGGEQHYDIISALHKSLRGSDPQAGLYWLARMLEAGEDPLYVARRLVRFASEDVGMADPQALVVAMAAQQAVHFLGTPEGFLALAELTVYLATAPKSNALYTGYDLARQDVATTRNDPVPLHLRNAPTGLMRDLGYGAGYKYAHDFPGNYVRQQNLPDSLGEREYYKPTTNGFEQVVAQRLREWREWPESAATPAPAPDDI